MFFMIQEAMVAVMPSSPERDRREEGLEERLHRVQTPENGRLSILKNLLCFVARCGNGASRT